MIEVVPPRAASGAPEARKLYTLGRNSKELVAVRGWDGWQGGRVGRRVPACDIWASELASGREWNSMICKVRAGLHGWPSSVGH